MISIKVPPLGESIVEATVSRWLKQEGEAVSAGETLVELETDKVTVEVPATTSGVLVRRAQKEGDVVALGAVLGELDETAAGTAAARPSTAPPAPAAPQPTAAPAPAATPVATTRESPRASPGARRLAGDEGVDLADVTGTGRGGVVSKPDVVEYVGSGQRAATSGQQAVSEQRPASIPTPAAPLAAQAPAAPVAPVPSPARPPAAESPPRPVAPPTSDIR
ncbi:MAG TPA: biotin/lipoyl-containing protein, partial [Gemmatimonadaceae bacterium]|nr:biotin/lipoyl-containing protein [Gemmatimonadaceae bacterium]